MHGDGKKDGKVKENGITEEQLPQDGNVLEKLWEYRPGEGILQMIAERHEAALLHPHQLADELLYPGTEDGQGKTGNVLVRPQRNGKKTEDQGSDRSGCERANQGD